ncbi:MAG: protein-L-isoaspartate O-methyltransferase family protein, partial [Candidatus Dormibacteraceae bacterium]
MLDARAEMVATQLRAGGITDPRVLAAMAEIPREEFLPAAVRERAYENGAIPIGHGQTISQPLVVATMTEALRLVGGEGVLEIGTGSGYQAAVLARLCRSVVTVELEPELAEAARATLARLGLENVKVVTGDGHLGWPPQAPYEAILVL